jgi:hypothetical protein
MLRGAFLEIRKFRVASVNNFRAKITAMPLLKSRRQSSQQVFSSTIHMSLSQPSSGPAKNK